MKVTVYKCETTGQLFEDEEKYKAHRRSLKLKAQAEQRRVEARAAQAALVAKAAHVASVPELLALANEITALGVQAQPDIGSVEYRLQGCSTVGLASTSMQLHVLVIRQDSRFGTDGPRALEMLPGVRMGSGNGVSLPADAGPKAKSAMNYSVTLEFDKLPGLKATRDAIVNARREERLHEQALQVEAEETLFAESSTYRDLQEELAQAEAAVESLRTKLDTAEAQRQSAYKKMRAAAQVQYEEMLATRQEPAQKRAALEALMKVGSV